MGIRMRTVLIGLCATAAVAAGAGTANAGEINGQGQPIQVNARSLCAFSGLEDDPPAPGTVQNWGHTKSAFGLTGGANSVQTPFGEEGCNAHLYPRR